MLLRLSLAAHPAPAASSHWKALAMTTPALRHVPPAFLLAFSLACGGLVGDEGHDPSDACGKPDAGTPTAVVVNATTPTTSIGTESRCSGKQMGTEGDLPAVNAPVVSGATRVDALTLRYYLNQYFGEPTRRATVAWEGTGSLSSLLWLAEVQSPEGRQYVTADGERVFAAFNVGTIKEAGAGFGTDVSGSPSWSQTFVTYASRDGAVNYGVDAADAKNIYRSCFKLANVRVLKLNGEVAFTP